MELLAFDLGAESGRAVIGSLDGERLSLRELHRFANLPVRMNGRLHWNLPGLWEHIKTGLRKCAGSQIDGVGIETWGVDFCLLGRGGELLGLPCTYRDSRTDGMVQFAIDRVGRERLYAATGIQILQINTLYQLLALRRMRSSQLDAAETLLLMPDLVNFLLTGERKSEYTIATTTQMLDPHRKEWATDLLESLELPTHILPEIVQPGSRVGMLREDIASECDVKRLSVIAPGCHDTAGAVAAVPARGGDDWCYISSGTWSLMGVEIDHPIVSDQTREQNFTNEGGVGGTIRLLRNIVGLWLVQECRREFSRAGHEYSYAELTDMARHASCDSIVDPDDPPFLSPGQMPQKVEAYCRRTGQTIPSTPGEVVRVCLASLAQTYREALGALERITARTIQTIHIVGGGSRNELLNQMTADACQRTVLAGPVEATAVGNVLVQAIGLGRVSGLAELRHIVARSFEAKQFAPQSRVTK